MIISELIAKGREIEKGLTYVHPGSGIIRTFDVYRLSNLDEYYRWKEFSIRTLQLYYPTDLDRFVKYSEDFEKQRYLPRYISNMVGVLEACEALPSERAKQINLIQKREEEIAKVLELEKDYVIQTGQNSIHKSCDSFHNWHAAACVLFDKWFYSTDEDWVKFQDIEGSILIEGELKPGMRVVVVEDLVSTGGSSLKAVEAIRQNGCDVVGMVASYTYGFAVATEAFKQAGVRLITLTNYDAVLDVALRTGYITEAQVPLLHEWRRDPAHWHCLTNPSQGGAINPL